MDLSAAAPPSEGEAHLWLLPLDHPPLAFADLASVLDGPEQARAARFHFPRDQARFTAARGLLRRLLGAYAGVEARALRFDYGPAGKPSLAQDRARAIAFNLSHSGGWALLGVTPGPPIGVDIEAVRSIPDYEAIARANFSPGEVDALLRVPSSRRSQAFFACWTRKEAYLKAVGVGLSMELKRFEVSVDPDQPATLLSIDGSEQAAREYGLWSFRPAPDAWAAVAVRDRRLRPRLMRLRPAS